MLSCIYILIFCVAFLHSYLSMIFILYLVTFLRDSLALTTMALVMAVTGKLLETSNRPAPLWALGISSIIIENRVIQLIASNPVVIKVS